MGGPKRLGSARYSSDLEAVQPPIPTWYVDSDHGSKRSKGLPKMSLTDSTYPINSYNTSCVRGHQLREVGSVGHDSMHFYIHRLSIKRQGCASDQRQEAATNRKKVHLLKRSSNNQKQIRTVAQSTGAIKPSSVRNYSLESESVSNYSFKQPFSHIGTWWGIVENWFLGLLSQHSSQTSKLSPVPTFPLAGFSPVRKL